MVIQTIYSLRFTSGTFYTWLRFNSLAEIKGFLQEHFEKIGDTTAIYIMKEVYTLNSTTHFVTKTETQINNW